MMQQQSTQAQHSNPSQHLRNAPQSPAATTAPPTPSQSQHFQQRPHIAAYHQPPQQHYPLQQETNQIQHIRPQPGVRPAHPQQHPTEQQLHHPSMAGPLFQSQPSSVQSLQEHEIGNVGQPRLAQHGHTHISHQQQVMMGQRHVTHHPSQQQTLISQQQNQNQQHPPTTAIRIEQSGQVVHMHAAPPAPPPHQTQRIFVQQQQQMVPPLPPQSVQTAHDPSLHPPPLPHPHLYIGSQRFTAAIMAEMEAQPNVSPKQKYRDLKKKFKYLVYENEYYQEELRNLQRKLLKLSRDKNFLLDRLGQYEQLSESSDDSDASTKTLEERGVAKQKKKPKPSNNRKRAAPNPSGAPTGQPKRIGNKTTPAKCKVSGDAFKEMMQMHQPIHSQVKEEMDQFGSEPPAKRRADESLASPPTTTQRQSDGREGSLESGDKMNEVANCSSVISANSVE
ncbi:hypothetical protein niasHT_007397 [Heterodera trifolii]|uniref:INO80 complex subunit E N-terminal domain-containing protein n=1 Tax=Heterodera trifolii TaxID=157864 RepID=A0ABD2LMH0_9BILA